jgi:hypothetical protein
MVVRSHPAGAIDLPVGTPVGCALLGHCFTLSKDSQARSRIARALTVNEIALLRLTSPTSGELIGRALDGRMESWVGVDHLP